jgi:hypothetical protein
MGRTEAQPRAIAAAAEAAATEPLKLSGAKVTVSKLTNPTRALAKRYQQPFECRPVRLSPVQRR